MGRYQCLNNKGCLGEATFGKHNIDVIVHKKLNSVRLQAGLVIHISFCDLREQLICLLFFC